MKKFYQTFFVVIPLDLKVKLYSRNTILKLQSLAHNQFLSPRFTHLFKYARYKSDYLEHSKIWYTWDFCFKKHSKSTCDICGEMAI